MVSRISWAQPDAVHGCKKRRLVKGLFAFLLLRGLLCTLDRLLRGLGPAVKPRGFPSAKVCGCISTLQSCRPLLRSTDYLHLHMQVHLMQQDL